MGIINIVKNVKEIHPNYVVIINVGKFYYTYGKDSYIISYLFNYKLDTLQNVSRCSFSNNSINKIMAKLEQKKINYIMLDRKNNYNVDEKCDNKNLNTYYKVYEQAKNYINSKKRIDNIYNYLLHNINNKKLINEIEKILENDRRKI